MTEDFAGRQDTEAAAVAPAPRKALIVSIVGVVIAFLVHPLVGGITAALVAWLAKPLSRRARLVFAVLAPLFLVFGLFFSFIPFGLG